MKKEYTSLFSSVCEKLLNQQINTELTAFYEYLNLAFHFDRSDVALEGFHKFFLKMSDEELGHAKKLMKFQNERGSQIMLEPIRAPVKYSSSEPLTPLASMEKSCAMEKHVYDSLFILHQKACEVNDPVLGDLINEMLAEQVTSIKEFHSYITTLKRVGSGLGEFSFDRFLKKQS